MNTLIKDAKHIPVSAPVQTMSITPVTLEPEGRPLALELRITAPIAGQDLPIVLLSHGHGPSLYIPSKDGYGPLVDFYARHGFVVIQPTHLNSKVAGLPASAEGGPMFWDSRVRDMTAIIDNLDRIESLVPALAGRMDHARIAVVGHSLGGMTAGMLLGALLSDSKVPAHTNVDMREKRIMAGVLLGAPGLGGDSLTAYAAEHYSCMNPDFATLTTPTLVVAGSDDAAKHITVRGPAWFRDPYDESPGARAMLTLTGGGHGLGGIAGHDARETDDEDPERLAVTQRMSWAFLASAFNPGDPHWEIACRALSAHAGAHASVEQKARG